MGEDEVGLFFRDAVYILTVLFSLSELKLGSAVDAISTHDTASAAGLG